MNSFFSKLKNNPILQKKWKRIVISVILGMVLLVLAVVLPVTLSPRGQGLEIENGVLISYNKDKKSVTLPESVAVIGQGAFREKSALKKVIIKGSPIEFEEEAFYKSSIEEINLPIGLEKLGNRSFYGCSNLKRIVLPDGITEIGDYCFYGCISLTEIVIPKTLTSIGKGVFAFCENIRYFSVEKGNSQYISEGGILLENGGETLISYPAARSLHPNIEITLSDRITTISEYAFSGMTALTGIYFPNLIKQIEDYAFSGCSGLEKLNFPSGLEYIGEKAFFGADKVEKISLPNGLLEIGEGAFGGMSVLQEIELPFLGRYSDSSLSSLSVTPAKAESNFGYIFGREKFEGGKEAIQFYSDNEYRSYYLPATLKRVTVTSCKMIPDGGFYGCESLEEIYLPEEASHLGKKAFANCFELVSVSIPSEVREVGDKCFFMAKKLSAVSLGSKLERVGVGAFAGCEELKNITVDEENIAFLSAEGILYDIIEKKLVAFPQGQEGEYSLPDSLGIKEISAYAFYGSKLSKVKLCSGLERIGEYAFFGALSLSEIELVDDLIEIGGAAFWGCREIKRIVLPRKLSYLGEGAFFGCEKLDKLYCEIEAKPATWSDNFDVKEGQSAVLQKKHIVVWGYESE